MSNKSIKKLEERIYTKSKLWSVFGVSRKTFNTRYLPGLLTFLRWETKDWKELHNKTFSIDLSVEITRYIDEKFNAPISEVGKTEK